MQPLNVFRLTTSRYDFLPCRRTVRMRMHGESNFQFASTQNFNFADRATDKFVRAKQFRSYGFTGRENIQRLNIDDGEFLLARIMKSALRNTAMQRHLAAFKSTAHFVAGAGLLSLAAFASGTAELRADTTANAHLAVARTLGRLQIRKIIIHSLSLPQNSCASPDCVIR